MFIWDFAMNLLMDQLIDWAYTQIVGYLGAFFSAMGAMGADLFDLPWVQYIVLFFAYFAWALYVTGLIVSAFETAIEYQNGRGNVRDALLNALKGFMAVSLFTLLPVELYKLAITLQASLTAGITAQASGFNALAETITSVLSGTDIRGVAGTAVFGGGGLLLTNPIMILFLIIMVGYAVIKVFFSSLKRGGILLIQISVGSLYMFSVPRGHIDGFMQWCKQVIGLCLTTFMQATILTIGLLTLKDHALLGLGLMLSASEVPRIAGAFGLDTSTRGNLMGAVHATQSVVNTMKTISQVASK